MAPRTRRQTGKTTGVETKPENASDKGSDKASGKTLDKSCDDSKVSNDGNDSRVSQSSKSSKSSKDSKAADGARPASEVSDSDFDPPFPRERKSRAATPSTESADSTEEQHQHQQNSQARVGGEGPASDENQENIPPPALPGRARRQVRTIFQQDDSDAASDDNEADSNNHVVRAATPLIPALPAPNTAAARRWAKSPTKSPSKRRSESPTKQSPSKRARLHGAADTQSRPQTQSQGLIPAEKPQPEAALPEARQSAPRQSQVHVLEPRQPSSSPSLFVGPQFREGRLEPRKLTSDSPDSSRLQHSILNSAMPMMEDPFVTRTEEQQPVANVPMATMSEPWILAGPPPNFDPRNVPVEYDPAEDDLDDDEDEYVYTYSHANLRAGNQNAPRSNHYGPAGVVMQSIETDPEPLAREGLTYANTINAGTSTDRVHVSSTNRVVGDSSDAKSDDIISDNSSNINNNRNTTNPTNAPTRPSHPTTPNNINVNNKKPGAKIGRLIHGSSTPPANSDPDSDKEPAGPSPPLDLNSCMIRLHGLRGGDQSITLAELVDPGQESSPLVTRFSFGRFLAWHAELSPDGCPGSYDTWDQGKFTGAHGWHRFLLEVQQRGWVPKRPGNRWAKVLHLWARG